MTDARHELDPPLSGDVAPPPIAEPLRKWERDLLANENVPPDVPVGVTFTRLDPPPAPRLASYEMVWITPGRVDGELRYQLDPSWEGHDDMIKRMSLLERRILKVWMETVIESIDRAAWSDTTNG